MLRDHTHVGHRRLDLALILLFVGAILAPAIDSRLRPDTARGPEAAELRAAAPRPAIQPNLPALLSFPERYSSYFDDAFGLRDILLRWHSIEKVFVFGVSPSPKATIGRDLWMFYPGDHSMEVFRGVMPFTTEELEDWRLLLERRRDYLARRGIEYVFMIGPAKESIYPEYVPSKYNQVGPTRMDQLVEYLGAHSDFRILDLRPALLAARAEDRPDEHLYYELGTHWNGRGGDVAARELLKRLHELFPRVKPVDPSGVKFVVFNDHGDSEARRMYIEDLIPQRHTQIRPAGQRRAVPRSSAWDAGHPWHLEVDDPDLPSALIFHDSFGPSVEPVVGDSFRRSTWIQTNLFDVAAIDREKPDVVISLYVERVLAYYRPSAFQEIPPDPHTISVDWDNARDMRYRFEPSEPVPSLKTKGRLELTPSHDEEGSFCSITMREGADMFLLPEFEWANLGRVLVRVDISTPVPTLLTLFYLSRGQTEYSRHSSVTTPLAQGRNHLTLAIPARGVHGRLMIRPGAELGSYVLRGLEVRAADSR